MSTNISYKDIKNNLDYFASKYNSKSASLINDDLKSRAKKKKLNGEDYLQAGKKLAEFLRDSGKISSPCAFEANRVLKKAFDTGLDSMSKIDIKYYSEIAKAAGWCLNDLMNNKDLEYRNMLNHLFGDNPEALEKLTNGTLEVDIFKRQNMTDEVNVKLANASKKIDTIKENEKKIRKWSKKPKKYQQDIMRLQDDNKKLSREVEQLLKDVNNYRTSNYIVPSFDKKVLNYYLKQPSQSYYIYQTQTTYAQKSNSNYNASNQLKMSSEEWDKAIAEETTKPNSHNSYSNIHHKTNDSKTL